MANVTEISPPEAPPTEDIPSETGGSSQTPMSEPVKKRIGRPPRGSEAPDPQIRASTFFDRVAKIDKADWGTRAWLYVYIDEPIVDEKQWGKLKYAKKLHQPIFDLEPIKGWYGSCKGWLSLNFRKPDNQNSDQLMRYEFEIFDIHTPPKIPKGCWTDDPANKKWAALLPPDPVAKTDQHTSLLDTMKVIREIKEEVREEMGPQQPDAPPADSTRTMLETLTVAKQLFAPAAAAPVIDPFDTAKRIMDMRSNDPFVALLMKRLEDMDTKAEAARAREFELQKQILEAKHGPPSRGLVDQITELAGLADKIEPLKKLFGWTGAAVNGAAETVRHGRTQWLDIVNDHGGEFLQTMAPLIQGIGARMMNNPAAVPMSNGTQVQAPADALQEFIAKVGTPKMLQFFQYTLEKDEPLTPKEAADAFAAWMYEGFPEFMGRLQKFSHPMMPGLSGAPAIIQAYKSAPSVWNRLAPHEPQFQEFAFAFCSWKPEDDGIIDAEAGEPEETDLDAELAAEERPS